MNKKKLGLLMMAASALLLLGSSVGGTRAAITYYSDNYVAEITVSQIGVTLLENGEAVSSRDYDEDTWKTASNRGEQSVNGVLLADMLGEGEQVAFNKPYTEKLTVKNSGTIDTYVRARVYRYWMKGTEKVTTLSPELIDLNFVNENKWVKGPGETPECTELFYKGVLPSGKETEAFVDSVRIDGQVAAEATVERKGNIITTTYKYDGVEFHVDVEVDAVQTHNAQDAIKSAWGVDASELGIL